MTHNNNECPYKGIIDEIKKLVDRGYFTYDEFDDHCNLINTDTEYTDKLKQILSKVEE